MNDGRKDDGVDGRGLQKARYDLVPPAALELVVQALTYGAAKYGDDNWRRVEGGRHRYFAALMRHSWAAFRDPAALDLESGLPHYAHAGACVLFLLERLNGDA